MLDRLDRLAEAEGARFAPSLRSRGIDPASARQVVMLRDDLLRHHRGRLRDDEQPSDAYEDDDVRKWLLLAYPDRVVKRRGSVGTGIMVGGRGARLSAESVVRDAEFYLAIDAREDRRSGTIEVHVAMASQIEREWLEELFPDAVRHQRLTRYDEIRRCVVSAKMVWYQDLLLREGLAATDLEMAGDVLAEALRSRATNLVKSNPLAALWLARLEFVKRALPELAWPEFDDEAFAAMLELACKRKSSLDEVEQADFVSLLQSTLTPQQVKELRESAPLTLTIPSGRQARLTYEPGRPPVLAARVQEIFGWTHTPQLARGRVPILLHLLGPNNRPVQVTSDLHSFWTTTYHQVRKDLRARYPKHAWPEDPLSASPSRVGKKR
jgi:ATP-dependent helicase HrpB